jgi:hypothetical protein
MAINYSTTVKTARLNAVVTAIGTTGVLEILSGTSVVLATIALGNPAGTVSGAVLTLTTPVSDAAADATGTAAAARIRTSSGGTDVITGLTVGTTGTDVVLDSVSITAGQTVTINTAQITHAA